MLHTVSSSEHTPLRQDFFDLYADHIRDNTRAMCFVF